MSVLLCAVSFCGKRHRGFGFVEYKDERHAAAALKEMAGKDVEKDKPMTVEYARVRCEDTGSDETMHPPATMLAEDPAFWECSECGWKNRGTYVRCGGGLAIGCGLERSSGECVKHERIDTASDEGSTSAWIQSEMEILEQRLLELIDSSPDSLVMLAQVPLLYHSTFGVKIDYRGLGYDMASGGLKACISEIESISDVGLVRDGVRDPFICRTGNEAALAWSGLKCTHCSGNHDDFKGVGGCTARTPCSKCGAADHTAIDHNKKVVKRRNSDDLQFEHLPLDERLPKRARLDGSDLTAEQTLDTWANRSCLNGHTLRLGDNDYGGFHSFSCDKCGTRIEPKQGWSCRACRYDVCAECVRGVQAQGAVDSSMARTSAKRVDQLLGSDDSLDERYIYKCISTSMLHGVFTCVFAYACAHGRVWVYRERELDERRRVLEQLKVQRPHSVASMDELPMVQATDRFTQTACCLNGHTLRLGDNDYGGFRSFSCDKCGTRIEPKQGWSCRSCRYDVCAECVRGVQAQGAVDSSMARTSAKRVDQLLGSDDSLDERYIYECISTSMLHGVFTCVFAYACAHGRVWVYRERELDERRRVLEQLKVQRPHSVAPTIHHSTVRLCRRGHALVPVENKFRSRCDECRRKNVQTPALLHGCGRCDEYKYICAECLTSMDEAEQLPMAQDTDMPTPWTKVTQNGITYYWNTETNATQHEHPGLATASSAHSAKPTGPCDCGKCMTCLLRSTAKEKRREAERQKKEAEEERRRAAEERRRVEKDLRRAEEEAKRRAEEAEAKRKAEAAKKAEDRRKAEDAKKAAVQPACCLNGHTLRLGDNDYGGFRSFSCDKCGTRIEPKQGWSCRACRYDVCAECVRGVQAQGSRLGSSGDRPTLIGDYVKQQREDIRGLYNEAGEPNTGVYVQGLPGVYGDDDVIAMFAGLHVSRVTIPKDKEGKPRGIALLEFDTHEHALQAVLTRNNTMLGHKQLQVSFKTEKPPRAEPKKHAEAEEVLAAAALSHPGFATASSARSTKPTGPCDCGKCTTCLLRSTAEEKRRGAERQKKEEEDQSKRAAEERRRVVKDLRRAEEEAKQRKKKRAEAEEALAAAALLPVASALDCGLLTRRSLSIADASVTLADYHERQLPAASASDCAYSTGRSSCSCRTCETARLELVHSQQSQARDTVASAEVEPESLSKAKHKACSSSAAASKPIPVSARTNVVRTIEGPAVRAGREGCYRIIMVFPVSQQERTAMGRHSTPWRTSLDDASADAERLEASFKIGGLEAVSKSKAELYLHGGQVPMKAPSEAAVGPSTSDKLSGTDQGFGMRYICVCTNTNYMFLHAFLLCMYACTCTWPTAYVQGEGAW